MKRYRCRRCKEPAHCHATWCRFVRGWHIGQRVRVRGHRGVAQIESFYRDIPGGVRLNQRIGDFYSWNVEDLKRVTRRAQG